MPWRWSSPGDAGAGSAAGRTAPGDPACGPRRSRTGGGRASPATGLRRRPRRSSAGRYAEAMPNVGPMELAIVLVVALLVLGPKRLPEVGRSLGNGIREFKDS